MSLKGMNKGGGLLLGLDRGALLRILAGERLCLPEAAGAPHVCVFFEETDELLLTRLESFYPGQPLPPVVDLRQKKAPGPPNVSPEPDASPRGVRAVSKASGEAEGNIEGTDDGTL